jgi:hypothetical protein
MATPTQPLGLSAAAIAVLQVRQARPLQPDSETVATPAANPIPRANPAPIGRGRFIDILA